ncbi:DNA replication factor Dna2-domain-containing protein [Lipomyces kononenkoae]|uniref:DNA replication factor Dna2-domain-containing protein n=1 Tax=Lipomyces kononenkoae TaxID=34357 RepID=A0ACC3T1Z1_LIPKO
MGDTGQHAEGSLSSDDNIRRSQVHAATPTHHSRTKENPGPEAKIYSTPAPRDILRPISLDSNGVARRTTPGSRKRTLTDGDVCLAPNYSRQREGGNEESITWNISPHPSSENDHIADPWSSPSRTHHSDQTLPVPADPATELLMRYNAHQITADVDSLERCGSSLTAPSVTPSVRLPSNLRRSVSCDPEWPATLKKRRRRQQDGTSMQVETSDVPTGQVPELSNLDTTAENKIQSVSVTAANGLKNSDILPSRSHNRHQMDCQDDLTGVGSVDEFGFNSDDIDFDIVDNVENTQLLGLHHVVVPDPEFLKDSQSHTESDRKNLCDKGESERRDGTPSDAGCERLRNDSSSKPAEQADATIDSYNDEFSDFEALDSYELEQLMAKLENPSKPVIAKEDELVTKEKVYRDTANTQKSMFTPVELKHYRRFLVEDVTDGHYMVKGHPRLEKRIQGLDEQLKCSAIIILRDDWVNSTVGVKGYINVIGEFDSTGQCVIDNRNGILIVHPDYLVSSTIVSEYFFCARKSVLAYRIKSPTDVNRSTVYGTIIHELFQECMTKSVFTIEYMDKVLEEILPRHIEKLFFLDEPVAVARAHVRERFDIIRSWAERFVSLQPKATATVEDSRNPDHQSTMAVVEVLDTEEHIWCPMYGLKGSIDMTVTVDITGQGMTTVPFEIKTGRNSKTITHRAQTVLYTLMLADRYDADVVNGILYYLDLSQTLNVAAVRNEIRGLIMGRNEIARSIYNPDFVLPMSRNAGMCKNCFSKVGCFVYHKAVEDGDGFTSGLGSMFDEATDHIKEEDKTFLKHWDRLITLEENSMAKFRQEIWLLTGAERESYGRCYASLKIDGMRRSNNTSEKINKYEYVFSRAENIANNHHEPGSFLASQMNIGDPIIVSDEFGHIALAAGFLKEISQDAIVVTVDREFDSNRHHSQGRRVLYRVDKDEFSSGMALVRNNLVRLIERDGDQKRRKLIVAKEKPMFEPGEVQIGGGGGLNEDQLKAVNKVVTALDYALIMGMPGTGKTTTVSHIIEMLLAQNKTILLTSYTHTAVDNILLKVRSHCTDVLRLGPLSKIHPDVKKYANVQSELPDNFDELREFYYGSRIVATTCLGINNLIFQKRRFDYCIVDEASQITLPICIGPLRFADKFVLVGDHYQLSPLVRNKEAKADGLDVSLFRVLSEAHPGAVASLEHQYRMCEEVMTLSNVLIYNGRLKCGSPEVAERKLSVPGLQEGLKKIHGGSGGKCGSERCWIADLLAEQTKVVFVDTDLVPGRESKKGDRVQNEVEAMLVTQLTESLIMSGVEQECIGIISVYRAQLKLVSNGLKKKYGNVEMQTVDKFQGRDKECVIISLVRSNEDQMVGDLLTDWRRLNVTFTRARSKLVIFGSKKTLMAVKMLAKFFELVESKGWIYRVGPDAHLLHPVLAGSGSEGERARMPPGPGPAGPGRRLSKTAAVVKYGAALESRPILRNIVNEMR